MGRPLVLPKHRKAAEMLPAVAGRLEDVEGGTVLPAAGQADHQHHDSGRRRSGRQGSVDEADGAGDAEIRLAGAVE